METYKTSDGEARFLESQGRLMALADRLFARKPVDNPLHEYMVSLAGHPAEVRQRLAATALGTMLLPEGASLGLEDGGDYYPDIHMHIGTAALRRVGLVVSKFTYPRHEKQGEEYVQTGTEALYDLTVRFAYYQGDEYAAEEVGMETATSRPGVTPFMYGNVWALAYAETGYEGHNMRQYKPSEAEALGALSVLESMVQD